MDVPVSSNENYAYFYMHNMLRIIFKMRMIVCMNSREIIRRILADGWFLVSVKGSHQQFKHPTKPGRVTVPHPKSETPLGTLKSIEKQAGIKLR